MNDKNEKTTQEKLRYVKSVESVIAAIIGL